ncbi:MAG: hypothetical protein ACYS7Y_36740 [Planctomycetota bacterium]|jgi:hypothetical protein
MTPDTFGWIASVAMLAGGYGVAHKKLWIGLVTGLYSLLVLSLAFCVMDFYAINMWSRNETGT